MRNEHRLGSRVVNRAAEQLAAQFNSERIALAIASALNGTRLAALQLALVHAHNRAVEVLATAHLPQVPSREDLLAAAKSMFVRTRSLDDIVERAYEVLLVAISTRLAASTSAAPA